MKTDPTRRELMRALQPYRATLTSEWGRDGWDMARESAIYWFGRHYHGGQWSNLYSVLSTSPYRPGPFESGPEVDEGTMCLYDILEGAFRNEN